MNTQDLRRRDFLKATGIGMASLTLHGCASDREKRSNLRSPEKPNILFIFSDQQRWDTVNCYGSPMVDNLTPNLDHMAAEGVRFHNSFTCQPLCGPARSCLQTGKYATETACYVNGMSLPRTEITMAHWLSEVGYEAGYIGKWHLASDSDTIPMDEEPFNYRTKAVPPERRGGYNDFWLASDVLEFTSHAYDGHMFDINGDRWEFPENRYRVDVLTDWALEYIQSREKDKPFFLFLSYVEPHHQNDHHHFEGPHGSKEKYKEYRVPGDLAGKKGDWKEEMPDYLGCCNSLDQNVGRIREELERLGLTDNTLIIYTCDHACQFYTRTNPEDLSFSEYKRSCHDNSIRTPLIMYGPGFKGGKVIENLVSLIDLTPTVLTSGGITPPEYMRGRPLQELIESRAKDWPEEVFIQISESHCGRAIRTKRWKYSVRVPGKDGRKVVFSNEWLEDFLYDLEADPHELNNLIRDPAYKKIREKLAETLKHRMAAIGENKPVIRPRA